MILTHFLPATDVNWGTSSIDTLTRLSAAKQHALNRVVLARVELIRLALFSSVDLGIHVAAAAAKFTIAVIELPACLIIKGLGPRAAFNEAHAHAVRSVKLAIAIFCAPLVGFVNPQWSISLYQRLSLVDKPTGRFGRVINTIAGIVTRNPLCVGALLVGALVGARYLSIRTAAPSFFSQHAAKLGLFAACIGLGLFVRSARPAVHPSLGPMTQKWFDNIHTGYKVTVQTSERTFSGRVDSKSANIGCRWIRVNDTEIPIASITDFSVTAAPPGMTEPQWNDVQVGDVISFVADNETKKARVFAKHPHDQDLQNKALEILYLKGTPGETLHVIKDIRYIHKFKVLFQKMTPEEFAELPLDRLFSFTEKTTGWTHVTRRRYLGRLKGKRYELREPDATFQIRKVLEIEEEGKPGIQSKEWDSVFNVKITPNFDLD